MRWESPLLKSTFALVLACAPLSAADANSKTAERLNDAAELFTEVMDTPDKAIPRTFWSGPTVLCWFPASRRPPSVSEENMAAVSRSAAQRVREGWD